MDAHRMLVVACHPDDEVLGCGGTIAKVRAAGGEVRVIFLAEGITARYDPSDFDTPSVREEIDERNANAFKALSVLGVAEDQVSIGQRYCCRLDQIPLIDLTKEIERHIRDFKPDRIYGHASHDANIDHQCGHKALLAAVRPMSHGFVPAVFAFEVLSSTEWNPPKPFAATAFVDITDHIDAKVAALAAYGGEMRPAPHSRSDAVMRALACYRGSQCGVAFAEGFSLIRSLDL